MAEERIDHAAGGFPSIGQPALRAFRDAGIRRLEDCAGWTRKDLSALHGVGPRAIRLVEAALAEKGLAYREG
ncbi:MAG TPA: hypothetical protein VFY23_11955 [Candidatus Limnocylindrales bacterium]|nr:hypothetical protein [Candidatus Limnocylindrales bacterium]